jgi:uncharacterized membrane protein YesL
VLQGKQNQASGVDFYDILDRISAFALANMMWFLLSLPIVTMPAATAGLFAAVSPWSRGQSGELFRDFTDGMRRYWRKSTAVVLFDVVVGVLVFANLSIFPRMNMPQPLMVVWQSGTVFIGALVLAVNLYAWPLMMLFDMPVGKLLYRSLQLVFAHPWRSLELLAIALVPLLLGLVLPVAAMIIVSFSACALLISRGAWRVMRLYLDDEDLNRLEAKAI